jgi:hypothetical protein
LGSTSSGPPLITSGDNNHGQQHSGAESDEDKTFHRQNVAPRTLPIGHPARSCDHRRIPLSHPIVMMGTMKTAQLTLISTERPWKLDDGTRRVGREGLAKARAVLAQHLQHQDDHELAA